MDLKQALAIIDGGSWVSLRFITADVAKGSGGTVVELAKARICRNRSAAPVPKIASGAAKRQPNHHFHFTRNMELDNKQIRKVHPILITHLNQEAVL